MLSAQVEHKKQMNGRRTVAARKETNTITAFPKNIRALLFVSRQSFASELAISRSLLCGVLCVGSGSSRPIAIS